MSLFSEVTVTRLGYGARRKASLFVLDSEPNPPLDRYSHGLRRRVAEKVSRHSFDGVVASIEKTTGLPIATGVIEGACRHLTKDRMDIKKNNHTSNYVDPELKRAA